MRGEAITKVTRARARARCLFNHCSTRPFMKTTIKAIQRGVKAALAGAKPQAFKAGGKAIACSHCGEQSFVPHDLSRLASEGLLREHYGLECPACGHLELFTRKPIAVETGV